jgi:hypothetical protein
VYQFLELRPHRLDKYKPFYQGAYDRRIPPDIRQRLAAHFDPLNRELYQWLGREFDWA